MKVNENLKYLFNILLPIAVVVLCFIFLPKVILFLSPLILGLIIAIISDKIISFIDKKRHFKREHLAIFTVILIFILIAVIIISLIYGAYIFTADVIASLPTFIKDINLAIAKLNDIFLFGIPYLSSSEILGYIKSFSINIGEIRNIISASIYNVLNLIVYIIFTIVFAYVLLVDNANMSKSIKALLPKSVVGYTDYLKKEGKKIFFGWFKAQIFCAFIIMIILFIGFLYLKVKFALLLALIIAIVDALPIFGSGLFLWPWMLINLINGDMKSLFTIIILYILIQLVRNVIQNKYMQAEYNMNGVITLIIIFIGYKFYGLPGLIFSLPVGMFIISLYRYGIFDDMFYSIKMLSTNIKNYLKIKTKNKISKIKFLSKKM